MRRYMKNAGMIFLFSGLMLYSFADRGVRKKAKTNHVILNVSPSEALKKKLSELKSTDATYCDEGATTCTSIKTFQKGNTIYIQPAPQKIITTEIKQGYTGLKLIIKSR